jgi:hypothetical protein
LSGNPTGFFTNYFTSPTILGECKNLLDITDQVDDVLLLNTLGPAADTDITAKLYPFSDSLPLTGDYLTMAQNSSIYKVAALYKARKNNKELADFYNGQFKATIENLITSLKANLNTRTKRVQVSTDYKTIRTYSQIRKWWCLLVKNLFEKTVIDTLLKLTDGQAESHAFHQTLKEDVGVIKTNVANLCTRMTTVETERDNKIKRHDTQIKIVSVVSPLGSLIVGILVIFHVIH